MDLGDTLTDNLARILVFYKELGLYRAFSAWYHCLDPDAKLEISRHTMDNMAHVQTSIEKYKTTLSSILNDDDFESLMAECSSQLMSYRESTEQHIELSYRPSGLTYNRSALINNTDQELPEDIQISLSLGYKFLSPYSCHDGNMHCMLAQLDQCIWQAIPDLKQLEASIEIHHILKARDRIVNDDTKNWLKFIQYRTSSFFESHEDIFATRSDKGAHTVVYNVSDYEAKLGLHINEGNYTLVEVDPLQSLIRKEKVLVKVLRNINVLARTFYEHERVHQLEPDTLLLPKFYGLPKIHKQGTPLRPITSTVGAPGYYLAKFFDGLLKGIFPRSDHHVKDSYVFVKSIKDRALNDDDVLVSFDVVSMFTSIPYKLVYDIIMGKAANTFSQLFGIGKPLLKKLLKFLLRDCMVFTALDHIYKQDDGLPMGSCLSPTVARLVMDDVVANLLDKVPQISFIKVFVDDTITIIHKDYIDKALEVLNNFCPGQIKFTLERENNLASLNFLNTTVTRDNGSIRTNWYRKHFASGRLLNFYTSHKRTTVVATAIHFIRTVLLLSDPSFFQQNRPIVIQTLRDNSFPETNIVSLMNNFYTLMRTDVFPDTKHTFYPQCVPPPKPIKPVPILPPSPITPWPETASQWSIPVTDESERRGYKIFPHSICEGRRVKRVIHALKAPGVILADSVKNSKINSITTRKTETPTAKKKNLILISQCTCKKRYMVVRTKFNETGEIARRRIRTRKRKCDTHGHAYRDIQFHRGLQYYSQTGYLLQYVQWKYRHHLDPSCGYAFPDNDQLRRLVIDHKPT